MVEVIDSAVRPRFSRRVSFSIEGETARIEDGTYRVALPSRRITLPDLERWSVGGSPAELVTDVGGWLDCGEDEARAAVERLFSSGLLVDPDAGQLGSVPGAYVACRLIDTFRRRFSSRIVRDSPLMQALTAARNPGLAMGYLLETYFVVRAARWSAQPVFGHAMTDLQRQALEAFRDSESGHGELLLGGFAAAGFDAEELRRSPEAVETMAYSHAYGAFACQGVAEFAAALVLPEVREFDADNMHLSVNALDVLQQKHEIPDVVIRRFRAHDDEDLEGDHGGLPSILLSEERDLTPIKVDRLFTVLRQMMDLYRGHLDAIHRRYVDWEFVANGVKPKLPDNAFRF